MEYIGEHLLPGQLGHLFIVLSLVASLIATFSYFKSAQSKNDIDAAYWKKLARIAFITEVISVFAIFAILFYIISNHLFEYKYAWQHSSRSLEVKYLLACFWEGQEGSFLLWSVWHCVLGLILIKTSKKWEAPVMTVVSLMQFALATMIAGIYFFGWKMGTNPFILLRDSGVLDNAPALHINGDVTMGLRQDYMLSILDGNDLNPLLQNYWMVIHPPVLFMGFASTIIPFAFVIAGLWKKNFGEWTKPALPWALFSAAVFGIGIMMGAMWAYESLTFGGYWAWDPVENASLVPWLILISGIHTLLIYKHTGHSLRATHLFLILTFGFVLYSTFLTRSGILGETSVHAFTDLGMNMQLLIFLLMFVLPALVLFIYRYKEIPTIHKEESTSSREFWMFIGSLVFFLSALVIIGKTSIPVVNKILGTKIAPPEKAEFSYNQIMVFIAIIIAVLTAVTQYLKYKSTGTKVFLKKILIPFVIAAIIATLVLVVGKVNYEKETFGFMVAIWMAVACSIFTIVANASYIWLGLKGKLKLSGGSISHVGFGMVLLGILISSSNKEVLSNNIGGIPAPLDKNEDPRENLTLVKGLTVDMGKYSLTYEGDSSHPKKQLSYYKVHFKSKDGKEEFVLTPNSFVNYKGNEGLMSNPDSRHYWNHDVFTYITSISNPDKSKDTTTFRPKDLKPGDTLFYSSGFIIYENLNKKEDLPVDLFGKDGSLYEANLKVHSKTGSLYSIAPKLAIAKGNEMSLPDTVLAESIVLQLQKVTPDKSITIGIKESNAVMDYITLKAYKFPYIRLLWFGVVITAIGIIISMVRRIRLNRENVSQS
ncbi:MAG: cytochrome c biogenesis protein CcsA [Chitinophagaceae bacterium]|nr:cytochrome c biogenesis protein CcsA [Chitinophagaceae bacterium]MBP6477242.1 cytochrome c biogenesis protein CcsA [Chitinophagaceae bacterium]MBP7108648.1 cytochrome c biogenesis protein CcsA [Chitinophagaceae bacterium]MBP7313763.1 cytochrome c biogenesis protein CcsA [Chitinophagaceae bacterium]HQV54475.1 cytochrome c biogenesis protein CcsA [Chitinophagaceae bacterium]